MFQSCASTAGKKRASQQECSVFAAKQLFLMEPQKLLGRLLNHSSNNSIAPIGVKVQAQNILSPKLKGDKQLKKYRIGDHLLCFQK